MMSASILLFPNDILQLLKKSLCALIRLVINSIRRKPKCMFFEYTLGPVVD